MSEYVYDAGTRATTRRQPAASAPLPTTPAAATLDVRDFGAMCDGVADDTRALQACLDAAFVSGAAVLISGVCRTTSTVGLSKTFTTINNGATFPSIIGVKSSAFAWGKGKIDGSVILADGIFTALSIKASRAGLSGFCGGTIRDLTIVRKGGFKQNVAATGLELEYCYDYRLYNVATIGFGVGFSNTYGWSWDAFGLTCTGNHVGVLLDDNSNACSIQGLQGHGNVYGVRVLSGDVVIERATLEGQSVGLVAVHGGQPYPPPHVTLRHSHFEQVSGCAVQVGTDIDGTPGAGRVAAVNIDTLGYSNTNKVPIFKVDNVDTFSLSNFDWGSAPGQWQLGDNIGRMRLRDVTITGDVSYMLGPDSTRKGQGFTTAHNILPNGHTLTGNAADLLKFGTLVTIGNATHNGAPCIEVKAPPHRTPYVGFTLPVKVDPSRAPTVAAPIVLTVALRLFIDDGVTVTLSFYSLDAAGVETNVRNVGGLQTWPVDSTGARRITAAVPLRPDTVRLVGKFTITNASGADKFLRFASLVALAGNASLSTGALDVLHGLSGRLTATAGALVQTVALDGFKGEDYEVTLTPYFAGTAYATKGDGSFTATFSGPGSCSYSVTPRIGVLS